MCIMEFQNRSHVNHVTAHVLRCANPHSIIFSGFYMLFTKRNKSPKIPCN